MGHGVACVLLVLSWALDAAAGFLVRGIACDALVDDDTKTW